MSENTYFPIRSWSEDDKPREKLLLKGKTALSDAELIATKLGIPFEVWDFQLEYKTKVIDYMIQEYAKGRTPNPDVMCNGNIKFGIFLKTAMERKADFVASGHYARIEN